MSRSLVPVLGTHEGRYRQVSRGFRSCPTVDGCSYFQRGTNYHAIKWVWASAQTRKAFSTGLGEKSGTLTFKG